MKGETMSHEERIACILWFTYWKGRTDTLLERLRPGAAAVDVARPVDADIAREWDHLDPEEKARFLRAARDFVR